MSEKPEKKSFKIPRSIRPRLSTMKCTSIMPASKDRSALDKDSVVCTVNLVEDKNWEAVKKGKGATTPVITFKADIELKDSDAKGGFKDYSVTIRDLCDNDKTKCAGVPQTTQSALVEQIVKGLKEELRGTPPGFPGAPPPRFIPPPGAAVPPPSGPPGKPPGKPPGIPPIGPQRITAVPKGEKLTAVRGELVTELKIIAPTRLANDQKSCDVIGSQFKEAPKREMFQDDESFQKAMGEYNVSKNFATFWLETKDAPKCIVGGVETQEQCKDVTKNFPSSGATPDTYRGAPTCVAKSASSPEKCASLNDELKKDISFQSLETNFVVEPGRKRCVPVHTKDGITSENLLPYEELCKLLGEDPNIKKLEERLGWKVAWDSKKEQCVTKK